MNPGEAYRLWSLQYDTNENRTRDLEALALRKTLDGLRFRHCLEAGCGTGKNTAWLAGRSGSVAAIDLSEEMLSVAKNKTPSHNVQFQIADLRKEWPFKSETFDMIVFSLVLEHIEDLSDIFIKAAHTLLPGAKLYIGELHPARQYIGSQARFETENGTHLVEAYIYHLSDYIHAASSARFALTSMNEFFDDDDRRNLPRILALLFTLHI